MTRADVDTRLERVRAFALDRGGLLAVSALVLYVWLAPPHIVDGDNAELSAVGSMGGTAHPSGYPLYLLWLRATAWLPGASPAHTAAIATAILGAAVVLVLHAACRAWGARPLAATVAVAIFAAAPIAMRSASRAEVFALNCLVVAAVLWLSARNGPLRGARRAAALGLVAGLGISNHLTCTLVAPVGILGLVYAVREAREAAIARAATVAIAAGALVVGLTPYLYLFVTPETPMSWGAVRSLDDLVGMITRRDYGGPGAFLPGGKPVPAVTQLAALAHTLGRTWLWAPLALGLGALVHRVARGGGDGGETRWAWAMLALSWLVAGPLLALKFNIEPVALGLYVVQRFHLLPALLLAIPVAVGLSALAPWLRRAKLGERAAITIVSTLGFLAVAGLTLPHLLRVHTPAVQQFARNVLRTLPRDAVLFAGQDDLYFGINHVQWVLGERQDATLIAWQLTLHPWYAQRMMARGIYAPDGPEPAVVRVVDYLLKTGRPVFVEQARDGAVMVELVKTFPTYPYGVVIKVLPRGSTVPSIDDVVAENKAIYDRFQLGYPHPGTDDEFATAIHHRYASTWNLLGRKLAQQGKHDEAAWAFAVARELGPRD